MSDLNSVPSANRLHIALYGRRNCGKSSLINALTGQEIALVSPVAGTTADPVRKAMEVRGIGPCVWIDTAGFDDTGELGALRVERTRATLDQAEVAVLAVAGTMPPDADLSMEREWLEACEKRKVPVIPVITKADLADPAPLTERLRQEWKRTPLAVSSLTGAGISALLEELIRVLPEDYGAESITGGMVQPGDTVLLVMPQDSEAPKGRLILPQVQTIRDLLDHQCVVIGTTPETMPGALSALREPPALIITDSQVFRQTAALTPPESRLTSFSILFAAYKGDLSAYLQGAEAVDKLTEHARVLIAEACTHAPLSEDIGRVKIPALLRKRYGQGLRVDIVGGSDFPEDLTGYDLVVHCGGCMFSRKYLLSRIRRAQAQGVPITNYGVLLAKLNGILDRIAL